MKVTQRPIKPSADKQQRQVRAPPRPPKIPPSAPAPPLPPAPPAAFWAPGGGNGVLKKGEILVEHRSAEDWTYRGPDIFSL